MRSGRSIPVPCEQVFLDEQVPWSDKKGAKGATVPCSSASADGACKCKGAAVQQTHHPFIYSCQLTCTTRSLPICRLRSSEYTACAAPVRRAMDTPGQLAGPCLLEHMPRAAHVASRAHAAAYMQREQPPPAPSSCRSSTQWGVASVNSQRLCDACCTSCRSGQQSAPASP